MTMPSPRTNKRILYFGMINTSHYSKLLGCKLYVAAGALKMLSVTRALRSVGIRASIITLPVLGNKYTELFVKYLASGKDGAPILFLTVFRNKFFRKIVGFFSFAAVALFLVRRYDKVIIYNHSLEYILALLILFARRIPVYHDIEDLPFENDHSINGLINSVGYWFANKLSQKKILVSKRLADILCLKDYHVVNGVCNRIHDVSNQRWTSLSSSPESPLCVHYGGTLIKDTGIDLFCEAIELLIDSDTFTLKRPIHFYITGTGHIHKIEKIARRLSANSFIKIFIYSYLPYENYVNLLCTCHISLALKKPNTQIANTTFPSKVIEITSYGLALVSTKVSDVPLIFNHTNSFLLPSFAAQTLANTLVLCARSPRKVQDVAQAGHNFTAEHFSLSTVGLSISKFAK